MSRGAKIGCGVVLGLFVASALFCGGLYFFAKDYFTSMAEDFAGRRPELEADAKKTAVAGPEGCVSEGLARTKPCGDFGIQCRVEASLWTTLCLEAAEIPTAFCDGVPPQTEIMDVSMWGLAECQRRGYIDDGQCPQFLAKTVAAHCEKIR